MMALKNQQGPLILTDVLDQDLQNNLRENVMTASNCDTHYDNDEVRTYRNVVIQRNRQIKSGELGCYYVKDSLRTSIEDAKEYIDAMLEACGIEFFNSRENALLVDA